VLRVTTFPGVVLNDPPLRLDWSEESVSACGVETRDTGRFASTAIDFLVPAVEAGRKFELDSPKGRFALGKPDDSKGAELRDDRDVIAVAYESLQDELADVYRQLSALRKDVRRERNESIDAWHELKVAREAFDASLLTHRQEVTGLKERIRSLERNVAAADPGSAAEALREAEDARTAAEERARKLEQEGVRRENMLAQVAEQLATARAELTEERTKVAGERGKLTSDRAKLAAERALREELENRVAELEGGGRSGPAEPAEPAAAAEPPRMAAPNGPVDATLAGALAEIERLYAEVLELRHKE
jgi:hypothetical protein